jgi:regulator of nonsense transcripts 2
MSIEADLEAQVDALAALQSLKKEREYMISERSAHLPVNMAKRRKEIKDQYGSKMKSDLKKSTAFVKKVKAINAEGLQQCIRDTETLNLNQYVSEIVAALLEMNFKPGDVPAVVKLCISLHDRYEEFQSMLITGLRESVMKPLSAGNDDAARARRLQMRLLIEFYQVGVINNEELFCTMLRNIIGKDKR